MAVREEENSQNSPRMTAKVRDDKINVRPYNETRNSSDLGSNVIHRRMIENSTSEVKHSKYIHKIEDVAIKRYWSANTSVGTYVLKLLYNAANTYIFWNTLHKWNQAWHSPGVNGTMDVKKSLN